MKTLIKIFQGEEGGEGVYYGLALVALLYMVGHMIVALWS